MSRRAVSVTEWVLGEANTKRAIDRVAELGYGSIELAGDPSLDLRATKASLERHDMTVSSICGMNHPGRDCAQREASLRNAAGDYLRGCLECAHELAARVMIVVPTYRVDSEATVDREAELDRAADTIRAAADGLADGGPMIALEALNRYETHLIRTLDEADELRRRIDSPRVGLMADLFHMNIEEDSIEESLRRHAEHLIHVHVADSQRREPGSGHLPLQAILKTLATIDYRGALTMEFLPATDAALLAARQHIEQLISVGANGR
jgi:D-psicose/D-tagatose/L-ribulose 3-epimerase